MPPDFTGLVLGDKYRLTRPLGSGGMGYVWEAEHLRLGRAVAVKLLRPELVSDPAALARFQQEATAAARIGSPYIVDVLDVGATPGGAPFLVMEKLRGRSLAELRREQPVLPLVRATDIARQILAALAAAHAAGIVHRDLKPDNVFLEDQGDGRDHVKILDFGIAKAMDDPKVAHLTRTGMLVGTPRYMSPEQATGRRGIDGRTDVWSVGVLLYECLAGRLPHEAPDLAGTLGKIIGEPAAALRSLRPEIDPALDAAVLRALAKDPEQRFPTAGAFREALGPDPFARPAPAPALAGPRRPAPVAAGATVVDQAVRAAAGKAGAAEGGEVFGSQSSVVGSGSGAGGEPSDSASLRMYDSGRGAPAIAPVVAGRTVPPTEFLPAAGGAGGGAPSAIVGARPVADSVRGGRAGIPEAGGRSRGLVAALIAALVVVVVATVALAWYFATHPSRSARGAAAAADAPGAPADGGSVDLRSLFPDAGPGPGGTVGDAAAGMPATAAPDDGDATATGTAAPDGDRALYVAVTVDVGCRMIEYQAARGAAPAADEQQRIIDAVLAAHGSDRARYAVLSERFAKAEDAAAEVERGNAECVRRFFPAAATAAAATATAATAGTRGEAEGRELYIAITAEVSCTLARPRDGGTPAGQDPMAVVQRIVAAHGIDMVEYGRLASLHGSEPETEVEASRRANECMAAGGGAGPGAADAGSAGEAADRETYIAVAADNNCLPAPRTAAEREATPMDRALAAHGLTYNGYVALAQRFGNDPAVKAEIEARIRACTHGEAPRARE